MRIALSCFLAPVALGVATGAVAAPPAAVPWAPPGISSPLFESHPAFDPRTGDLYFVRSSPAFEGWRILVSHCGAAGWSTPEPAAFAGDGVEADPWFTPDGDSLWFISSRTTDGVKRNDLDVWRVDRDPSGHWGTPQRLPEPVNSPGQEWFPRPGAYGWLYFGSNRPGGLGKTDIWRARAAADGHWTVENAGPAINTAGDEFEPLPSADGTRMLVMADGGLYETRRGPDGWTPRVALPPQVNVNGSEIGALLSPSGRSLLFARDTGQPLSGELFVWQPDGVEAWPPACPAAAGSPRPSRDAAVAALLERQTRELVDAVGAGDRAVWERHLDADIAYTAEDGHAKSKADLVAEVQPLPQGITGTLELAEFVTRVHADTAVTSYRIDETEGYFGQTLHARYRQTDTWQRGPLGWKLIAAQVLALRDDPPAITLPGASLDAYVGVYALTPAIRYTIRRTVLGLEGERSGRKAETLKIEAPDLLFVPGQPRLRKLFERDAAGHVSGFRERRESWDILWRRVE